MSVQEIHVMEVEFLGNMRYSLLATKEEWDAWLVKLACFLEYYERAQMAPGSPTAGPSPTGKPFNSPLPSPTSNFHANPNLLQTAPVVATNFSPSSPMPANAHNWPTLQTTPALSSPLSGNPNGVLNGGRKRNSEEDPTEPPAKRQARQPPAMGPSMAHATPSRAIDPMRLPVPNLTINTNQVPASFPAQTAFASQSLPLPPLVPGVRAMSTVFSQGLPGTAQQLPVSSTNGLSQLNGAAYGNSGVPTHGQIAYGTPTKRHSPGSLSAYVSSPMADGFAPSGVHTPIAHTPLSHSPSVYLQQRPSPYKPIRHVNTLLFPPPSASLHEYHLPVPPTQMHYQPLGRRHDLRTGIVPEFMGFAMRQPQQGTPGQSQYPS
jgi:hypothetical protein